MTIVRCDDYACIYNQAGTCQCVEIRLTNYYGNHRCKEWEERELSEADELKSCALCALCAYYSTDKCEFETYTETRTLKERCVHYRRKLSEAEKWSLMS